MIGSSSKLECTRTRPTRQHHIARWSWDCSAGSLMMRTGRSESGRLRASPPRSTVSSRRPVALDSRNPSVTPIPASSRTGIVASGYLCARLIRTEARPILALLFDHDREPHRYVREDLFPLPIGSYFVVAHPECVIATVKKRLPTAGPNQIASWRLMSKAKATRSLPELRELLATTKQH